MYINYEYAQKKAVFFRDRLNYYCIYILLNNKFLNVIAVGVLQTEEVNTLGHTVDADLLSALGAAVGYYLTDAVIHHITILSVAAVDV